MMLHNLVRYSILFAIAVGILGLALLLIRLLACAVLLVSGVVMVLYIWTKYTYTINPFKL